MHVPFVDLRAQYLAHRAQFSAAMQAVVDDCAFVGGKYVKAFEADYARAYGVRHCIGVANGTDAIYIVLKMLGIGPGDEVITTAASWISTSETITQTGAKPVFVDVDEYFTLDPSSAERTITPRTKAVIPVHLYGHPARMDALQALCQKHKLLLVEDCAQAHFAEYQGTRVGCFGVAATFSFYPGKNLGAYGDAGAIVTQDAELANKCRAYANHGALVKHEHFMEGVNSRLDGLQAALLSAKLPHLPAWTAARQRLARLYDELLRGIPQVRAPMVRPEATHVYHLYVIRAERRDALRRHLTERGIETAIHYPRALPLLPAYERFGISADSVPAAARNQSEILSLPLYPEMSAEAVQYVVDSIKAFYRDAD